MNFCGDVRVFVYQVPTDMRCSFSGLSVLVESVLEDDPLSGHLFVFVNRRRDYVKVLYWEQGGYCIWSKRLEKGTYRLPSSASEKVSLSVTELRMIIDGFELSKFRRRKRFDREKHFAESSKSAYFTGVEHTSVLEKRS